VALAAIKGDRTLSQLAEQFEPELAQAHYSHGGALQVLDKSAEAEASFRRALTIAPDYAAAHFSLGVILQERGQLSEAEVRYRHALEVEPHYAEAHNNLANVLKGQCKAAQAELSYRAALALKPEFAEAHFNLGIVLQELNRHLEATVCYQRAITLKPEHVDAHLNLSVALLLLGRLEEGWVEYEWRCRVRDYERSRNFDRPLWNGEAGDGPLLLHTEQGMGDTIQFCRYASLAAMRRRVTLQVPSSLVRLLSNLTGVERVIAEGTPLPDFEASCPLLSLPRVFNTTLETIPGPVPYLAAEAERVIAWRERLPESDFRIGIAWAGSPEYKADRGRSAPLIQWAPLARIPGVQLISLQKSHGLDQLGQLPRDMEVHTLGVNFDCGYRRCSSGRRAWPPRVASSIGFASLGMDVVARGQPLVPNHASVSPDLSRRLDIGVRPDGERARSPARRKVPKMILDRTPHQSGSLAPITFLPPIGFLPSTRKKPSIPNDRGSGPPIILSVLTSVELRLSYAGDWVTKFDQAAW
jgi:Flp pilus assembly protein TadD